MSADARLTLTVKAETASDAIKAALESPGIDPEAWFVVAVSCWNRATRLKGWFVELARRKEADR